MKIIWSGFAQKKLKNILEYYKIKATPKVAQRIVSGIVKTTLSLRDQPYIGTIEQQLKGRNKQYRYMVYKKYKIIYSVNLENDTIEITDVFDTRQNPDKLKKT